MIEDKKNQIKIPESVEEQFYDDQLIKAKQSLESSKLHVKIAEMIIEICEEELKKLKKK